MKARAMFDRAPPLASQGSDRPHALLSDGTEQHRDDVRAANTDIRPKPS